MDDSESQPDPPRPSDSDIFAELLKCVKEQNKFQALQQIALKELTDAVKQQTAISGTGTSSLSSSDA